jgi:hypothetical protein
MRPILHGTALCPLFRFPTGARLRLKVVMDADLALDGRALVFAARPRYAVAGQRPLFRATLLDSPEAWAFTSPNTVELSLAPDAADETAESEMTLADLQTSGLVMWRLDVMDPEAEWPALRLQGDMEFMQAEGDWDDTPASTAAIPTLTVNIVAGVATVTVALMSDGASVNNAAVVAAIGEDPAAVREALELASHTDEVEAADVVVSPGDTDRFAWIQTVLGVPTLRKMTGLGLRTWLATLFAGLVHKSRHATGGADALTPGDIGALPADHASVTNARTPTAHKTSHATGGADALTPGDIGAEVAGAVRPNTSPTFTGATINGPVSYGASERAITGNFARTGYEYYGGANIGAGNLVGVQEFAVGFNNRIRFLAASTNVFIGGGACMQPKTDGIEINDGTRGVYRDLWLRNLIASGPLSPASYTVAAANALVGIATGSYIDVSNESGGGVLARYSGTAWKRLTDLATIS